jgi:hypothetical protein
MTTAKKRPRSSQGVRRAPPPEQTIEQIRPRLDQPPVSETFLRLLLRADVQLDLFKDKIAESLFDLVNRHTHFQRERLLRQDRARQAAILRQARFLEDEEDTRPLWSQIAAAAQIRERRAWGIERHGDLEGFRYWFHEQTDRRHVYGNTLLSLFAILRHLTETSSRQELFFEVIAEILQGVGVLPQDEKDRVEAIGKRFARANRWPERLDSSQSPLPVDFQEHFLFGVDSRFPSRPPVLPPRYYSIGTAAPTPPPFESAPDR